MINATPNTAKALSWLSKIMREPHEYPILPKITRVESQTARNRRDRSLVTYAPRDFDISPYFMVVEPTLARLQFGAIFPRFTPQSSRSLQRSKARSPSDAVSASASPFSRF
jgi:hypothetical protein